MSNYCGNGRGYTLRQAIEKGEKIDVLRQIVFQHRDQLKKRDEDGRLPLHVALSRASRSQSLDTIRFLVEQYPESVRERDNCGMLPLHVAIKFHSDNGTYIKTIRLLVEYNPEGVRGKDKLGRLPMHYAAEIESASVCIATIRLLDKQYQYPVDIRAKDNIGYLPLHCAIVDLQAVLRDRSDTSLEKIRFLVKMFPQSVFQKTDRGDLPLHLAAKNENTPAKVALFLANQFPDGAREKNKFGLLPLHYAARSLEFASKSTEARSIYIIIQFLVQLSPQSVKVKDKDGYLLLHNAVYGHDHLPLDVVRFLIEQYPHALREKTQDHGRLPLHLAVRNRFSLKSLELSRFLVKLFPESVKEKDNNGYLPLHYAASREDDFFVCINVSLGLTRFLVERYPQGLQEKTHNDGSLPLHLALKKGLATSRKIAQYFVQQCPESAAAKDNDGYLSLHYATRISDSCLDLVRCLVELFPQGLQERTLERGFLPLHLSLQTGNSAFEETSRFLIEQFPESVQVKDYNGYLPLHHAVRHSNASLDLVKLLVKLFPQRLQERAHDGSLPVFQISSSPAIQRYCNNLHLELIYLCVLLYPNFLFE